MIMIRFNRNYFCLLLKLAKQEIIVLPISYSLPKLVFSTTLALGLVMGLNPSKGSASNIIVDYSPDTIGVPIFVADWTNELSFYQNLGGSFSLTKSVKITGGSIFSSSSYGSVGDSVTFAIFRDITGTPSATPVVNVDTTLDTVDTVLTTTQPGLTRKHANISETVLRAGNYWFTMPGITNNIAQASGIFGDDMFAVGHTSTVSLTSLDSSGGKPFFTLEGQPVPEPFTIIGSMTAMGFGVIFKKRANKK